MKTRSASSLALLAALAAFIVAPLSAAPAAVERSYRVTTVERHNEPIVVHGTTTLTVRQLLGAATRKLDANTWVYENFQPARDLPAAEQCRTLLLTFSQGRVTEIKLVNDAAEKSLAAQLRLKSADRPQVAAK